MTPVNRLLPPYVVRLTIPINRFYEVPSLQHLCKHIVRNKYNLDLLAKLTLPSQMMAYIKDNSSEGIIFSNVANAQQKSNDFSNIRWCNQFVLN